jgi:hypothetical protein
LDGELPQHSGPPPPLVHRRAEAVVVALAPG